MNHTTDLTVAGQSPTSRTAADASSADAPAPVPRTLPDLLGGARPRARSLYFHVPFCFHKCHYCDFYSFVDSKDRQGEFTDRLVDELGALARLLDPDDAAPPELETVFAGGGTPSLLAPQLWERLLSALLNRFTLASACEFTVECNPETVTDELAQTLAAGGVNRASVGAQSFNTAHLKTLERRHDPESVPRALETLRAAGVRRLSVDLISAVPGQTPDEWLDDLDRALALPIEHVSAYTLTYEPNTAMTKRLERGEFEPAGESLEADLAELTRARLADAGFARYEVSNFAKLAPTDPDPTIAPPAAASRHNLAYWEHRPWLAAGPSASGHLAGRRWKNVPRLTEWMAGVVRTGGFGPVVDPELPDPRRALAERLMMGLRLAHGVDWPAVRAGARSVGASGEVERVASRLVESGEAVVDDRTDPPRLRLTEAGLAFADAVAARFLDALDD